MTAPVSDAYDRLIEADGVPLHRALCLRGAQPGQLRLALAAVAAVREVVVEVAGMRHELGEPRGQRLQMRDRALG